jgi:predicted dehydrogenase
MSSLRFAMFGAGFWANYQLAAWYEAGGATCVAICDPDITKAQALAQRFHVAKVYSDPREAFESGGFDFVDIVAPPQAHVPLIELAADYRIPAICQKPLANTLQDAQKAIAACRANQVKLFVHENWRWQTPLRELKHILNRQEIGPIFRGRVQYSNSFPVFDNQPALKNDRRFILMDIGTHILDAARFLFGDAESLACVTRRVRRDIQGEDVATVLLRMPNDVAVTCEMSYASRLEHDRFPETFVLVEGEKGSVELGPDYWLRVTTASGTVCRRCPPPRYAWADPRYDLAQSSMVPCLRNLLEGLRGGHAETTADDNYRTLQLVLGAYESAERGAIVQVEAML